MRAISVHAVWLVAVAAWLAAAGVHAENVYTPTPINQGIGQATEIGQWQIQSSAKAQQSGAEISAAGFSTKDWYPVSGRATVMAGLLENGVYKNVFYSDNLRAVAVPDSNGPPVRRALVVSHRVHRCQGARRDTHVAAHQRHDRERRYMVERASGCAAEPISRRVSRARARRDAVGARGGKYPGVARAPSRPAAGVCRSAGSTGIRRRRTTTWARGVAWTSCGPGPVADAFPAGDIDAFACRISRAPR